MGEISLPVRNKVKEFGRDLKSEFPFDPEWNNLNHGEQGLDVTAVMNEMRKF